LDEPTIGPARRFGRPHLNLDGRRVAIVVGVVVLGYLALAPLLMLLFTSVKETADRLPFEAGTPFTLDNYLHLILDPSTYPILLNTAVFVVGSLAIGMGIAVPIAWLIERTDLPLKSAIFALIVGSIGIPSVIIAIAWSLLLNPVNGLVNIFMRDMLGMTGQGPLNIYTVVGLFAVQGVTIVPISILLITASFRSVDSSLEEAASASGAPFRAIMRRITLPLLMPAILATLVYQFVVVVNSFDIPLILGLNSGVTVLSTAIYSDVHPAVGLPNYGAAAAYGVLLLVLAMVPLVVFNRITSHGERFATVSGRGYSRRIVQLGRWRWPISAAIWIFITATVILPFAVMVWTSVEPFYAVPSPASLARVTLNAYARAAARPDLRQAFINTAVLGVAAAFLAMLISLLVSWIIVRVRSRMTILVDALAFVPYATPGVIVGLTILLIYLVIPLPIYGTIWVLVIAMITENLAIGTRLMNGAITQIDRQLEDAGASSGATWLQTMRRITLPLLFPAFLNGLLLVFLASIRNLTQALILFTPGSIVVSTEIYAQWGFGDTSLTAVLGVLMSIGTFTLALVLRRYSTAVARVT
jgi:iron(III) transport system permease protein